MANYKAIITPGGFAGTGPSAAERRRNLRTEAALGGVTDTAISGMFAWGIFHSKDTVPL
jgi:hypothetical protein